MNEYDINNEYYNKKKRSKAASRIFWGLFFLAGGVAIVLNQLGLFSFMDLSLGNVIWSVLLVAIFIKSIASRFWFGTFLSLFFLFWIYAEVFGIAKDLSWWPILGAAIFLSIGFTILFRPKKKDWYFFSGYDYEGPAKKEYFNEYSNNEADEQERVKNSKKVDAENIDAENVNAENVNAESVDEGEVYAKASFGSTIKYVNSKNLKRAFITCSFGAAKMYFDNAQIPSGNAEINIEGSFCGIELYIPREWNVLDEMDHVMGGIEEKNPQRYASSDGPNLRLTGHIKFSGVEIIYV